MSLKERFRDNESNNAPLISSDTLFFGSMDGTAYALEAHNGKVIWKTEMGAVISTDLAMAENSLYFGTNDRRLIRLDKTNGTILKKMSVDGTPFRALLFSNDLLVFYINWAQPASELLAVDDKLATVRWRRTAPDGESWITKQPYLLKDIILAGTENGSTRAFRIRDGEESWAHHIPDAQVRIFGFDGNQLYIGTIGGMLYAFQFSHY